MDVLKRAVLEALGDNPTAAHRRGIAVRLDELAAEQRLLAAQARLPAVVDKKKSPKAKDR